MLMAILSAIVITSMITIQKVVRSMPLKISYNKLWKKLIDLNLRKYHLRERAHISSNSMAKLGRNEYVSLDVLAKICDTINCDIGDICEFERVPEE